MQIVGLLMVDFLKCSEIVVPVGDFHVLKSFKVDFLFSFGCLQLFKEMRKAFHLFRTAFNEDFICNITDKLRV